MAESKSFKPKTVTFPTAVAQVCVRSVGGAPQHPQRPNPRAQTRSGRAIATSRAPPSGTPSNAPTEDASEGC
jgi:hypothetical protein